MTGEDHRTTGMAGLGVVACAACCAGPLVATVGLAALGPLAIGAGAAVGAVTMARRGRATAENAPEHLAARGVTNQSRIVLAALVVIAAALLIAGALLERSGHHEARPAQTTAHVEASGEASEGHVATETADQSSPEPSERVLGVNFESNAILAAVGLGAMLLAGVVALTGSQVAVAVALAVSSAAVVFDMAEVVHQVNRSSAGLALVAALVAVVHAVSAAIAYRLYVRRTPTADRVAIAT